MRRTGFTLIELLVVLAIIGLMLSIAVPRVVDHLERGRETALKASLKVMRESIDKFEGDTGRLPESLDELVQRRYLRELPVDPITERRDTWLALSPIDLPERASLPPLVGSRAATRAPPPPQAPAAAGLADVRSGAPGQGRDGTAYRDW